MFTIKNWLWTLLVVAAIAISRYTGANHVLASMAVLATVTPLKRAGKAHKTRKSGTGNASMSSKSIGEDMKNAEQSEQNTINTVTSKTYLNAVHDTAEAEVKQVSRLEILRATWDACKGSTTVLNAFVTAYCKQFKTLEPSKQEWPNAYRDQDGNPKSTPKRVFALTLFPANKYPQMHVISSSSATRAEQRIQMWGKKTASDKAQKAYMESKSQNFATLTDEQKKAILEADKQKKEDGRRAKVTKLREDLIPVTGQGPLAEVESAVKTRVTKELKGKMRETVLEYLHDFRVSAENRLRDYLSALGQKALQTGGTKVDEQAPDLMGALKQALESGKRKKAA